MTIQMLIRALIIIIGSNHHCDTSHTLFEANNGTNRSNKVILYPFKEGRPLKARPERNAGNVTNHFKLCGVEVVTDWSGGLVWRHGGKSMAGIDDFNPGFLVKIDFRESANGRGLRPVHNDHVSVFDVVKQRDVFSINIVDGIEPGLPVLSDINQRLVYSIVHALDNSRPCQSSILTKEASR